MLPEETSKNDASMLSGRTAHNQLVHFTGGRHLLGQLTPVTITEATAFYMTGVLEEEAVRE